jgi:hypothetical protein
MTVKSIHARSVVTTGKGIGDRMTGYLVLFISGVIAGVWCSDYLSGLRRLGKAERLDRQRRIKSVNPFRKNP